MDETISIDDRLKIAQTLAAFMAAAHHAHDIDEGRMRQDFLTLAEAQLAAIGADGSGARAAADEGDGPRAIFTAEGKLLAPNGTEWDLGG